MANFLSLKINTNPSNFNFLDIRFYRLPGSDGYAFSVFRQFLVNQVPPGYQVRIGATIADTVQNLYDSLLAFNTDTNVVLSVDLDENQINFLFVDGQDYDYFEIIGTDVDYSVFYASVIPTVVLPPLPVLVIKDFSISIIDTYDNDLPLLVEFPSAGACEISWEGGDSLITDIISSSLKFNMLVPDYGDAHFIHLLTGDENRYRVELNAIDYANNNQLVWAGFLLPDEYREPYTNDNLFVDFTATDNLGVLKGKYFPNWYYYNKFPIAELLAMILEMTGLKQNLLVKPSLVPAFFRYEWHHIAIDLNVYIDDKLKKTDLNRILSDILTANCLTLKNYRGYWLIEGLTRKKDENGTLLQFDAKGRFMGLTAFQKNKKVPLFQVESVNITAVTPYRKVTFDLKVEAAKSMYTDNVVMLPDNSIFRSYNNTGFALNPEKAYQDKAFLFWQNNFSNNIRVATQTSTWKAENVVYRYNNVEVGGQYSSTEAMSLTSYLECPEQIFVKPGILYDLELQFFAQGYEGTETVTYNAADQNHIPFQFLLDGVEVVSNRPGFLENSLYRFGVVNANVENLTGSRFTLKTTFRVGDAGLMTFRILAPIGVYNDWTWITAEKLQVKVADSYDVTENVVSVNDINFTKELNYSVNLTCSQDKSVLNSMSLGLPISPVYTQVTRQGLYNFFNFSTYHQFPPGDQLDVSFKGYNISDEMFTLLFEKGFKKACFLELVDGTQAPFDNLYGNKRSLSFQKRAAFLVGYVGNPVIPRNYFRVLNFGDIQEIKVMYIKYGPEDYNQRLKWKIYGSSIEREFNKSVVNAIHGVGFETSYRLEADVLQIVMPDDLIDFSFEGKDRNFIPTSININLFDGKTRIVASEAKYRVFTDLIYE